MTSLVDILPHVTPFAAILARVAGLFLFTPILSSVLLPIPVRAMVVVMLTAALYPMADVSQLLDARLDVMELAPLMATESLIGLSLGLLASVPLMLVQVAGVVMGSIPLDYVDGNTYESLRISVTALGDTLDTMTAVKVR